ncbi:uncharacterized protein LOC130765534 [Actinidia eriantha]|uniref:uncharacterized protein LOC130765534 n=1 Tax=Actinidia eriantha TaxID=165200 RepID=UPI00258D8206|nr:uncharacterized protein LOC130765534 [Actinidia eriantha]
MFVSSCFAAISSAAEALYCSLSLSTSCFHEPPSASCTLLDLASSSCLARLFAASVAAIAACLDSLAVSSLHVSSCSVLLAFSSSRTAWALVVSALFSCSLNLSSSLTAKCSCVSLSKTLYGRANDNISSEKSTIVLQQNTKTEDTYLLCSFWLLKDRSGVGGGSFATE